MDKFRSKAGYSILGIIGVQGVSFLGFLVLARILEPRDFGLMAILVVLATFLGLLIEMGMGSAVIQRKDLRLEEESSAFWFLLIFSLIFSGVLGVSGSTVAILFDEPELANLVVVVALAMPANALQVVPFSLLQKKGKFREVAICEIVSSLTGLVAGIGLAILGYGVWALAVNLLIVSVIKAFICFLLSGWRPVMSFRLDAVRSLWGYSSYLFVAYIGHFLADNVDRLIAAKFLGANAAGLYSAAMRVSQLPVMVFLNGLTRVLFPKYSMESSETSARDHVHLVKLACFTLVPLFFFIFEFSDGLVAVVFGEKWAGMASVLGLLSLAMIPRVISTLNVPVFMASGETRTLFWVGVAGQLLTILGMLLGIFAGGLTGMAIGIMAARILMLPAVLHFPAKFLGIGVSEFVRALLFPTICAVLMVFIVESLRKYGFTDDVGLLGLLAMLVLSCVAYIVLSLMFQRGSILSFVALITKGSNQ